MSSAGSTTGSRVVLRNIRWETYEALLEARADDPAPRFAYDRGTLEILSLSGRNERLKRLLGRFVETYTMERGIAVRSAGSTTLKSQLEEKGLEPDESYYVSNERLVRERDDIDLTLDPPPDLAIEIDLTSSSVDKLGIYASLGVAEVWSGGERVSVETSGVGADRRTPERSEARKTRGGGSSTPGEIIAPAGFRNRSERGLAVFQLQAAGKYKVTEGSAVFPDLSMTELDRFLGQRSSVDETTLVRAFRDWVREKFGAR